MKQGIFLVIYFFINCVVSAQSGIFISDSDKNIAKIEIAPGNCNKQIIVNTGSNLSDITLHPNGKMYGVSFTARKFYEVNMTNGSLIELLTISEADKLVGMTAARDGTIYITEGNTLPSRLFAVDITTNTYQSKGWLDDGSAGDLSWYFGNLYNASDNNKLVKVNIDDPASSTVIGSFAGDLRGETIFALVTQIDDCDNSITYGLSKEGNYFELDMSTANVTRLCDDGSVDIFGATSTDEFSAAECFITLDLDENDNSGATGSDFDSDFFCQPSQNALIADSDIKIDVANSIDFVEVSILNGQLDGANEFFITNNTPNITSNNNAQIITGTNTGSATTGNFEQFLNTIRYKNAAFPITAGTRTIQIIAFSEGRSDTGFTTIDIMDFTNAGTNGSASFCATDPPIDLTTFLGGSPDMGGTWQPALNSNTGLFNPSIDAAGVYTYYVNDGCFKDSAEVDVSIASSNSFDLGNDTTICFASSYNLSAYMGHPSATYMWNNGSTDSAITVTSDGNYSVTVNLGGCQVQDDIDIEFISISLELGNDISVCSGDSILIGQNVGIAGANYSWSNGETSDQIYVSDPGSYTLTVEYQTCTVQDMITVIPALTSTFPINLGNDTTICEGTSLTLSTNLNSPSFNHLWNDNSTNSSIVVTQSGQYSVTVNSGCQTGFDDINITVSPSTTLPIDLGADATICDGSNYLLTSGYNDAVFDHLWSDGSTNGSITITTAGTYSVDISNECSSGSGSVIINECHTSINSVACEIKMPNAFSPNGDNVNDYFGPVNVCEDFISFEMNIYNRYGELVFNGINNVWDGNYKGEQAPMDNFIWYAIFRFNGKEEIIKSGNIVILR